jgi:hypothetical protein
MATYQVTFPGRPAHQVESATKEEAIKKAAEETGVLAWETPPEVVQVPAAEPQKESSAPHRAPTGSHEAQHRSHR